MMARFFKNREANKGLAPGAAVFIGTQKEEKVRLRVVEYNREKLDELEYDDIHEIGKHKSTPETTWINIDGLHDAELIKKVAQMFGLHSLLVEDVLNTTQRPKAEQFDDCLLLILKMMRYDDETKMVRAEQLSMVIGPTFLLTFQERVGDVFEPVRERIRKSRGKLRTSGHDYLAYALLDTVVDNYIYLISKLGEFIEDIEVEILDDVSNRVLEKIQYYKREMSYLRKSVRPVREFLVSLPRLDGKFYRKETKPFLNDLLDLATQATEAIDVYREMLSDQLNIYNSMVSNKMNDVMKVLTMFAAVFIPLTFIAGIYGTNFEYLPELKFHYSYFIFWGVMVAITVGMLWFFKRKGWIWSK